MIETQEYVETARITNSETNEFEIVTEKNPRYLTEEERKVYQTICNFIPEAQSYIVAGRMDENLYILPVYSCLLTVVFTGLGLFIFEKKN